MADYARRDALRDQRRRAESNRRLRTRRPVRGHVPSPTWAMEGQVTYERFFLPILVTLDPREEGDYPEYKRIVGVDGWVSNSAVAVSWAHNDGYLYENHAISVVGPNRVMFDGLSGRPEPFVIAYGEIGGEFIRPEILEEPAEPTFHLSCIAILETVPV